MTTITVPTRQGMARPHGIDRWDLTATSLSKVEERSAQQMFAQSLHRLARISQWCNLGTLHHQQVHQKLIEIGDGSMVQPKKHRVEKNWGLHHLPQAHAITKKTRGLVESSSDSLGVPNSLNHTRSVDSISMCFLLPPFFLILAFFSLNSLNHETCLHILCQSTGSVGCCFLALFYIIYSHTVYYNI